MRRDFTINALFYNIRSKDIEDFTEKGLDDLHNSKFVGRLAIAPATAADRPPEQSSFAPRFLRLSHSETTHFE